MKHFGFIAGSVALLAGVTVLLAQNGDKKGEVQELLVPKDKIPPAPVLTPEQARRAFSIQPGFEIQLVASEPMIEMPIAITFDPDGRMYVLEMRGYMPNPEGVGEEAPVGRVSVLEDIDGDGRMDKTTIFLDQLVMPRALTWTHGGLLLGEPPNLYFCRDTNSDLRCDEKLLVATDYGDKKNPEHTANGLVENIDNWVYNLYHTYRYRFVNGKWTREADVNRVQWGLDHDDYGRLFYTSNSDQLRGDLIPASYAVSRAGAKIQGLGFRVAADQSVWPSRVTPGVNRGYQKGTLRPDGTLAKFTAACGTSIYRGQLLGSNFNGNAIVCETSANLVRRNILTESNGLVTAENAYGKAEFLTSSDERFRPVNTMTGPDGALYIVDMYHGIVQHRIYMTTYLRRQVEERGLDKPQNLGRIWRVVPKGFRPTPVPKLMQADTGKLIDHLSHPTGPVRDAAQAMLVHRRDAAAEAPLREVVSKGSSTLARLHALWTLEGLDAAKPEILQVALKDKSPKIRAAAVRISEGLLNKPDESPALAPLRAALLDMGRDPAPDVQIQLALSLGALGANPQTRTLLGTFKAGGESAVLRDAAAFGLAGFEKPAAAQTEWRPKMAKGLLPRFEAGKELYAATCAPCHQPHGMGQEGLAPPLKDSEWVSASPELLIRVVLHGVRGPIKVKGQDYELDMPGLNILEDQQIADVITYVRNEWGHTYSVVDEKAVNAVRKATSTREDAWSAAELEKFR